MAGACASGSTGNNCIRHAAGDVYRVIATTRPAQMSSPVSIRFRSALLAGASSVLILASASTIASVPVRHHVGTAFDSAGNMLYTESHWISGIPDHGKRLILFNCPDGKAFARKRIEDSGEALAPLFELVDNRFGYREGVRIAANGKREVFVRRSHRQPEQTALLESVPQLVIDAGFDAFILRQWDELVAGKGQAVEFLLPSRLRSYAFVVSRLGSERIDGVAVQRFRLQLDAWFGFALPSIEMAYDSKTRAIREYTGVSNIRDSKGNNLRVRIEFPPAARSLDSDPMMMAAAAAAELDGQCEL
jgi:hypothetical protein